MENHENIINLPEDADIIGNMESILESALWYKVDVADIMCYPSTKEEKMAQKWCEKVLFLRAMTRIKIRRALSLSSKQKLLCEKN